MMIDALSVLRGIGLYKEVPRDEQDVSLRYDCLVQFLRVMLVSTVCPGLVDRVRGVPKCRGRVFYIGKGKCAPLAAALWLGRSACIIEGLDFTSETYGP